MVWRHFQLQSVPVGIVVLWGVLGLSLPTFQVCYHRVRTSVCLCVFVSVFLCVKLCIQKCPVTAVISMVPTLISLFPLISCCRLGTAENGSSACRDFRLFSQRFSWRDMVASCCVPRVNLWPLYRLADVYGRVCGARRLTWDSSELTVELQLLASG